VRAPQELDYAVFEPFGNLLGEGVDESVDRVGRETPTMPAARSARAWVRAVTLGSCARIRKMVRSLSKDSAASLVIWMPFGRPIG
jgi:hypothetical protein